MGGSCRDGQGIRCNFGCPLSRAGVSCASTCLVLPVTKGNSYFSPLCFAKQAVGRRRMEGGRLQRDNPAGPGDGDAAMAGLSSVPNALGAPLQPGLGFSSSFKSLFHHCLPSLSPSPCQDSFEPLRGCVLGVHVLGHVLGCGYQDVHPRAPQILFPPRTAGAAALPLPHSCVTVGPGWVRRAPHIPFLPHDILGFHLY